MSRNKYILETRHMPRNAPWQLQFLNDRWILAAIVATGINDAWLKQARIFPIVAGKISDFCGLFYFPFFS